MFCFEHNMFFFFFWSWYGAVFKVRLVLLKKSFHEFIYKISWKKLFDKSAFLKNWKSIFSDQKTPKICKTALLIKPFPFENKQMNNTVSAYTHRHHHHHTPVQIHVNRGPASSPSSSCCSSLRDPKRWSVRCERGFSRRRESAGAGRDADTCRLLGALLDPPAFSSRPSVVKHSQNTHTERLISERNCGKWREIVVGREDADKVKKH